MDFITYSVIADNCNSPRITYEVKGLAKNAAKFLAEHLGQAFRKVDVICEQTGEVVYNMYYNDDFKKTGMREIECLDIAQNIPAD